MLLKRNTEEDNKEALKIINESGFGFELDSVDELLITLDVQGNILYGDEYNLIVEQDDDENIISIEKQPKGINEIIWEREEA